MTRENHGGTGRGDGGTAAGNLPDPEGASGATGEFDPAAPEHREIGRGMADGAAGLGSVVAHLYRGEMERVTTWRTRLDTTSNLAVTVTAVILTWAFSSPSNPHSLLLVGVAMTAGFLGIEARRYQTYDLFRARVRLLQENLFANAMDPSQGVVHEDWRAKIAEDYRYPSVKVPFPEALAHRLKREYLPLLVLLGVAWVAKLTAFTDGAFTLGVAAIGSIPGTLVLAGVGVFYVASFAVALWPHEPNAKSEVYDAQYGEWKK